MTDDVSETIAACLEKGVAVTPQRHAMLRHLRDSERAGRRPSAVDIWRDLNTGRRLVSMSTVHRILKLFHDAGIVERGDDGGRYLYRLRSPLPSRGGDAEAG